MNLKNLPFKILYLGLIGVLSIACGAPEIIVSPVPVIKPTTATVVHPTRILFVGNSFTFFNDFPGMFANLAQSSGRVVQVDMVARGGWTCADHANSAETLDAIAHGKWDYVVLQEQSQLPALADQRREKMYPALRTLDEKIRESGATPILFMTWAWKNGLPEYGLSDYYMMQDEVQSGYLEIANELDVMVAPVGMVWQDALSKDSQLDLWQIDGIHPSKEGSYLAALVFYVVLFQHNPEELTYFADLEESEAQFMQTIAAGAILSGIENEHFP